MVLNSIKSVAVVGSGSAGSRHLRIAQKLLPSAEIRLFKRQLTENTAIRNENQIYAMQDLLEFAPQIAVIANPSPQHIEVARLLASRGTHLMIEKPISSSLRGVKELIQICNFHKLVLMVGYNLRYSPPLLHFREQVNSGLIGNVYSVRCEVGQDLPSWRSNTDYRISVSAKKSLGGGVLLELSHELDYLQWIFGGFEWVNATLTRQSDLEIDVEDSAHILLGFKPRNTRSQLIASLNMDFIRHDHTRVCVAIGEKGSLKWDGLKGEVTLLKSGTSSWEVIFALDPANDETYFAEWLDFIGRISGSTREVTPVEEELRVMEAVEAIRISSIRQSQVSVSEVQGMDWDQG